MPCGEGDAKNFREWTVRVNHKFLPLPTFRNQAITLTTGLLVKWRFRANNSQFKLIYSGQ